MANTCNWSTSSVFQFHGGFHSIFSGSVTGGNIEVHIHQQHSPKKCACVIESGSHSSPCKLLKSADFDVYCDDLYLDSARAVVPNMWRHCYFRKRQFVEWFSYKKMIINVVMIIIKTLVDEENLNDCLFIEKVLGKKFLKLCFVAQRALNKMHVMRPFASHRYDLYRGDCQEKECFSNYIINRI